MDRQTACIEADHFKRLRNFNFAAAGTRQQRKLSAPLLILSLWLALALAAGGCSRALLVGPTALPASSRLPVAGPTPTVGFPGTELPRPTTAPSQAAQAPALSPTASGGREVAVRTIPLSGPVAAPRAELSGLAWYGDWLILLPQYPARFQGGADGALFALPRARLLAFLDGSDPGPLAPQAVPFDAPGNSRLPGFEGYESIAFDHDRVFLTVETRPNGLESDKMLAYLVSGTVSPDLSRVRLEASQLAPIQPRAQIANMSDEALVVAGSRVVTFDEANGKNIDPTPVAHLFNLNLAPQPDVPLPNIEYRITGASEMDSAGRFWVINYFYPGDAARLDPAPDPLAAEFGQGPTHQKYRTVERLLQLQFGENGLQLSGVPPVELQLIDDEHSRDWEGLALLDGRGFLLVTDQHPDTILGFVPYSQP